MALHAQLQPDGLMALKLGQRPQRMSQESSTTTPGLQIPGVFSRTSPVHVSSYCSTWRRQEPQRFLKHQRFRLTQVSQKPAPTTEPLKCLGTTLNMFEGESRTLRVILTAAPFGTAPSRSYMVEASKIRSMHVPKTTATPSHPQDHLQATSRVTSAARCLCPNSVSLKPNLWAKKQVWRVPTVLLGL